MAMSPCGRYCVHTVVGCGVHIVDLVAGESVVVVSGDKSNVVSSLDVTEHHIVYAVYGMSRTEVAVVDRRTHLTLQSLHCDSAVTALSATSDGVFLVVSCYAGICVFNILTAECVRKKRGYGHIATVSPCNRWIASCDRLIDFETLEQIHHLGHTGTPIRAPVFSPEGDVVAILNGGVVDVFATRDGTHLHRTGHRHIISAVTFSADGVYLFTASFNQVDSWVTASHLATHSRTPFLSCTSSLCGLAVSRDMQVALILDRQKIDVVSRRIPDTRTASVKDANSSSQASSSVCPCC